MLGPRGRTILLALLALPAAARLMADEPKQTRVVIRGTGENVTLERVPANPRRSVAGPAGSPILAEAARLAASGSGDDAVIAYLARNQRDLPDIVEASDMKLLKKSGAGSRVAVYLEAVTAVDLGEMGTGHEGSQPQPVPEPQGMSLAANEYPNYPFYGGYGAGYVPLRQAFRGTGRFPHRPVLKRPMPVPFSSHGSRLVGRRAQP